MTTQNEYLHQKITMLEEEILRLQELLQRQQGTSVGNRDVIAGEEYHRSLEEHKQRVEAYCAFEEDL